MITRHKNMGLSTGKKRRRFTLYFCSFAETISPTLVPDLPEV